MPENRTSDETTINAVLEGVYKAWESNDADMFVADYTEDAVAILPGSFRQGREGIRKSMVAGFAGPLKGSKTFNKPIDLRFLGQNAAVVVSESGILFAGETELPPERRVYATWVLEKRDGRWLVASYHNSPASMPAS